MPDDDLVRLLELHDGFFVARSLHAAAELGVADLLADGPRTTEELAVATSTQPAALYRMLRVLAGAGVCTEVAPGSFALTPVGAYLRADHPRSVRSFLRWGTTVARAFDHLEHTLRTGTAGFDRVFGESLFDHLRADPGHAALFGAAMAEFGASEDTAVVDAYDFGAARSVVDIGGGWGGLLCTILAATPEATGVLFDQPSVVEAAESAIDAAGLAGRCTVRGGDFFREVPAGGDVYLLKSVIHDWPDEQAGTILRNCRNAMPPAGRLLLVERIVPAGDDPHPSKPMDLAMLVLLGGRERTPDEYGTLLAGAGFRVTRVVPTTSPSSVIEAVPIE